MEIKSFPFTQEGQSALAGTPKGKDWPVVYLITGEKDIYVGETTSAAIRMYEHLQSKEKQSYHFTKYHVIFDDIFNKSVILDYEQKLIKLCLTEQQYRVANKNAGQSASHNYFDRAETYTNHFASVWAELKHHGLAVKNLDSLENQSIFKYSPYNSLTEEQNSVSAGILGKFVDLLLKNPENPEGISLVNGGAGTGKTVMAISMINSLVKAKEIDEESLDIEERESPKIQALLKLKRHLHSAQGRPLKIGLLFPMPGIRQTIKRVFKSSAGGLTPGMVISPFDLDGNEKYDILLVDESHRLFQRKNLQNYTRFEDKSESLGLDGKTANQLDWVLARSSYTVLFYDEKQSIKGSDITPEDYKKSLAKASKGPVDEYALTCQIRCHGGDAYIAYLQNMMDCKSCSYTDISNYCFRIYDDVDQMVRKIQELDKTFGLCRTVAGYSWVWKTKTKKIKDNTYDKLVSQGKYDIDIDHYHYIWNLTTEDWIGSADSVHTIGCIHTVQGQDLNYVGIIFGREIDYDPVHNCLTVNPDLFFDKYVKQKSSAELLKRYIINTYTTMMTRGLRGCFVYAYNKNLREYLHQFIRTAVGPDLPTEDLYKTGR